MHVLAQLHRSRESSLNNSAREREGLKRTLPVVCKFVSAPHRTDDSFLFAFRLHYHGGSS